MRAIGFLIVFALVSTTAFAQWGKKKDKSRGDKTELSSQDTPDDELQVKIEATIIEAEKHLVLDNYEKAIELLKTALQMAPDNGAANFKLAEVLTKSGSTDDALAYAEAALKSDRSNKYYYLLTAEIYKAQGNYKAAAKLYDEMINKVPGSESYLYDLAIIYQYMGEDEKALEKYKKAEEIYGINEMALREKQKIYLKNGDLEPLIADWDVLIAENPDNPRYTIELVEFLIAQGMTEKAMARLNQVKEPNNIHVLLLKSQIAMKEGQTEKALKITLDAFELPSSDFQTKIKLLNNYLEFAISPEQFQAVVGMAQALGDSYPEKFEAQAYAGDVLYRMEEKDLARNYYLKALSISPAHYNVWQNVLNIESELNEYDSVIAHADEALEYFPNQAILYYFAGTGYLIKKNYNRSVTMLQMGSKYATDPSLQTIFYGQMGDAYNGMKDQEKSFESYEMALKKDPTNDHVLNNYSYYLSLDKNQLDKALEMSTRLVEMHPDNATYLDTHGWVLYTLGKYEEAEKFLSKAAKMENNGTIIEHYGDVLFKLGKVEEAVKQWEKASKLSDASDNIQKKIADKTLYE